MGQETAFEPRATHGFAQQRDRKRNGLTRLGFSLQRNYDNGLF